MPRAARWKPGRAVQWSSARRKSTRGYVAGRVLRPPVAVHDVRPGALQYGVGFQLLVEPLEPLEGARPALLANALDPLPQPLPGQPRGPTDDLVHGAQRDDPLVHEVAQVLIRDTSDEQSLLRLGAERVDLLGRRVLGQREQPARGPRHELRGPEVVDERERDLGPPLAPDVERLVRREAEADHHGDRRDDLKDQRKLGRQGPLRSSRRTLNRAPQGPTIGPCTWRPSRLCETRTSSCS